MSTIAVENMVLALHIAGAERKPHQRRDWTMRIFERATAGFASAATQIAIFAAVLI